MSHILLTLYFVSASSKSDTVEDVSVIHVKCFCDRVVKVASVLLDLRQGYYCLRVANKSND